MKKYTLRRLGVAHETGNTQPSLSACIEAVMEQSDLMVEDVLVGLQSMLKVAGGKTLHAKMHPLRQATVGQLSGRAAEVKAVFRVELRTALYGGGSFRKPQVSQVRFDDFQFLEEEQIDANIELAVTEQEILRSVEAVLPSLNALVSNLMGWSSVQGHLNPLKPEAFVHALRESFVQVVPDDESRSSVMAPAAGLLGVALNQMYRELVEWLKSQGVEPVAAYASSPHPFGLAAKPAEGAASRSMLTLDKLRRLLSGELDPRPMVAGSTDFTHTVPASFLALEDMKLVEPMLKRLSERSASGPNDPATGRVATHSAKPDALQGKALGKQLGHEVVRLMLENLMQDRRLLPGVRQAVARLEPVLQRVSTHDSRFFADRKHPARLFLDRMTHRSLGFQSADDAGYPDFQRTLDHAVHVLVQGDGDALSFDRLVRQLEGVWAREEQQTKNLTAAAAKGLLHAEQRNLLAQRLAQEFTQRMTFKNAPEMMVAFLRGPWAQVVAEYQLKNAGGQDDAEGYLALVDDLIWSVQPRLVRKNRERLVALVPGMLLKIRQGLALVDYPEERIPPFFDALISIHEQAFDNAKYVAHRDGLSGAASEHRTVPDSAGSDVPWLADSEAEDSGFFADRDVAVAAPADAAEQADPALQDAWSADSLRTGSWVDLALGGEWIRAQLSWASPHRTMFMFLSSSGMTHSMSRSTMDRMRGLGLVRLVSDGHVMDNALDAVAREALRNDVKNASDAPSR
jgi:hypothetical protein